MTFSDGDGRPSSASCAAARPVKLIFPEASPKKKQDFGEESKCFWKIKAHLEVRVRALVHRVDRALATRNLNKNSEYRSMFATS